MRLKPNTIAITQNATTGRCDAGSFTGYVSDGVYHVYRFNVPGAQQMFVTLTENSGVIDGIGFQVPLTSSLSHHHSADSVCGHSVTAVRRRPCPNVCHRRPCRATPTSTLTGQARTR
jgi:hypothetical protein